MFGRPYYQDNNCILYHADCRELEFKNGCIDVIFTDPPFGIKYRSNFRKHKFRRMEGDDKFDGDTISRLVSIPRRCSYIMGRWNMLYSMPEPDSVIAWIKNNRGMGDLRRSYAKRWDMIAFYANEGHKWVNGRPDDIIFEDRVPPCNLSHPGEKPVSLVVNLLSNSRFETILDPYMGTGTTICAAKYMNKMSIGIDIDERSCEIAATKVSQWESVMNELNQPVN